MAERPDGPEENVLERMLEVARHLNASADLHAILSVIINTMRDSLDADRATVFEYHASTDELFSTVAHGLDHVEDEVGDAAAEIRFPATVGLAGECAQSRQIINVPDAYADSRFNPEIDKATGYRTRSILTVPLISHDGELIGVAQVLNKRSRPFNSDDESIASALGSHAAVAIKRGRLVEDHVVRKKLERDLQLARRIQQGTFPHLLPDAPGYEIDAWSESAEETGGDTYDLIGYRFGDDGRPEILTTEPADLAVMLLADATGHGIGPALSVAQIRAMLRMAVRIHADIPQIARHMNEQLCADLPDDRFITAWLGELDVKKHTITGFSAGQAPLLYHDAQRGTTSVLDADSLPFGIFNDFDITMPAPIAMQPGDIFAVISDGIFEAADPASRLFGTERVVEIIEKHYDKTPSELRAILHEEVATFTAGRPADDDRTAIIIKRTSG